MVSENLNLQYANLSKPGASNLEIHWTIRHADIDINDLVFIEWSYPNRSCLFRDQLVQIGPWVSEELSRLYYQLYSDDDINNRNMLIIEHTALFLDHIGAKWMFFAHDMMDIPVQLHCTIVDYFERYQCDVAMDGKHPGLKSNRAWADAVTNHAIDRLSDRPWSYGLPTR